MVLLVSLFEDDLENFWLVYKFSLRSLFKSL